MTKRAGRSASNDPGFAAIVQAKSDAICLFAKSWDYHVSVALGVSNEENLEAIADSVAPSASAGRETLIDCEHFFDGYKANPAYALDCAAAAYEAGARWVVLCDTNGGALPEEVEAIAGAVTRVMPGSHVGIHTHNDTGAGRGQHAGGGPRGRAAGPGHAERPRRALRQRQPHHDDRHAGTEAALCSRSKPASRASA